MCCQRPMRRYEWRGRHSRGAWWGGPPRVCCHEMAEEEIAFGFRRRFESKAEAAERLERYLKALEAEAQAVRERLDELREAD